MERKTSQSGSVTILFAVILVCVTVLAALCVATARADRAQSDNYAAYVGRIYACESEGQRWLAVVDAALAQYGPDVNAGELPEGTEIENGEIGVTLAGERMTLTIRLRVLRGGGARYEILAWERQAVWQQDTALDLW